MLVQREPPSSFYSSNLAERKGAGAARRAIRNHREIADWLNSACPDSQNVRLVDTSIYEQFALFNKADLVVAQHEAALANIIFMRSGAGLLEIGPCGRSHFQYLAKLMGVQYHSLKATGNYPIVCIKELSQIISSIMAKRSNMGFQAISK